MDTRQHEAYINEYKGNLFEFLVGQAVADSVGINDQFYGALDKSYLDVLSKYESELRVFDSSLLLKLPVLAQESSSFLIQQYPQITDVLLVGKKDGIAKDRTWKEGDILLKQGNIQNILSLKLCKKSSFANTKSGGIRSFITKYFSFSYNAIKFEQEMNALIDSGFTAMMYKLYDLAGLAYSGEYDQQWLEHGLSELPGQLPDEMRIHLFSYYHELAILLQEKLMLIATENPDKFLQSIFSLMGFSSNSVDQLMVFHHNDHLLDNFYFQKGKELNLLQEFKFSGPKEIKSSFEITIGERRLQLRMKPMNKFTMASLKVNCSVKIEKS